MSTATATRAAQGSAPAQPALRFTSGARARDTGVFYDETATLGASSQVLPTMNVPTGDWLAYVTLIVTVSSTGNAAAVALNGDAPFNVISELRFEDAGGNAVHSLNGYNLYLANLLGGFGHQTDPTKSTSYTALTTGAGATAGSGTFTLRVPIEIISRDGIGVYPNGASNAALRCRVTLAPLSTVFSTSPSGTVTCNVQAVSTGYVLPSPQSVGGTPFSPVPPGEGSFQQWSQQSYDLTAGTRTIMHERKGQIYRTLLFVTRDSSGDRSDSIISSFAFEVDDVPSLKGPWAFCRDATWRIHDHASADLPTGVIQVSYCHEWDGKVGGELREHWVPTQPGTKVALPVTIDANGTLDIITNEIVAARNAAEILKV